MGSSWRLVRRTYSVGVRGRWLTEAKKEEIKVRRGRRWLKDGVSAMKTPR